jgi:hypothetical protein
VVYYYGSIPPIHAWNIHNMHTKGVWHTFYVVNGHMVATSVGLTVTVVVSRRFSCSWFLTWIMVLHVMGLDDKLYVMIGAAYPLHAHSRSTSYICNVFHHHHLLPWLVVIRMQPQPDVCWVTVVPVVGDSLGVSLGLSCMLWLGHLILFILISGFLHTCIMHFRKFYCGLWS